jgi:DNA-binding CsgD family transcriptional regulator
MNRRGRPPHPDILTPRDWEVLEFLRQRLSNEQIAERLGITLRTAKLHVSEILSKLAVESREQAAAWRPEEAPSPARRWLAWPLIARIAGALIMVAAVAGLGCWRGACCGQAVVGRKRAPSESVRRPQFNRPCSRSKASIPTEWRQTLTATASWTE